MLDSHIVTAKSINVPQIFLELVFKGYPTSVCSQSLWIYIYEYFYRKIKSFLDYICGELGVFSFVSDKAFKSLLL